MPRRRRPALRLLLPLVLAGGASPQQSPSPAPISGRVCGGHAVSVAELFEEMRASRCLAVSYSGATLQAAEVVQLAALLTEHPTRRLKLTDTELGDAKVEILASSLGALAAAGLADLDLSRVGMGDASAA